MSWSDTRRFEVTIIVAKLDLTVPNRESTSTFRNLEDYRFLDSNVAIATVDVAATITD